jgi:hypothetical protein
MAVNLKPFEIPVDSGFTRSGMAVDQPPNNTIEGSRWGSQAVLETELPASVAAKDNPSLTLNDKIYAARHKVTEWSATTFAVGEIVSHLGSFWYASTAAVAGDVPGTASLWKKTGAPYIS